MSTPEELAPADGVRADIAAAREELKSAIQGASNWDAARPTAEQAIGNHVLAAKLVCDTCGYPGPETGGQSFATKAEALEGLEKAIVASQGRIKYVSGKDLQMKHEGRGTVEEILMQDAKDLRTAAAKISGG